MANDWYVRSDNTEHGPIPSETLRQLVLKGKIAPNTPVKLGASGNWVAASTVNARFGTTAGNTIPLHERPLPPDPLLVAAARRADRLFVKMAGGDDNVFLHQFFQLMTIGILVSLLVIGLLAIGNKVVATRKPAASLADPGPSRASALAQNAGETDAEAIRKRAQADADEIIAKAKAEASRKRAMPLGATDIFKPIDMTKIKLTEGQAFAVQDDVPVNGRLVRGLTLGITKGGSVEMVVLMRNSAGYSLRPQMKIEFYNHYGMILGSVEVSWKLDTIASGGAYSENAKGYLHNISEHFRYSSVPLPADLDDPAYVVIVDDSR